MTESKVTLELIKEKMKNKKRINWDIHISRLLDLDIEIMREYPHKIKWSVIKRPMTEDNIIEFSNWINWKNISHYQNLSESFIREFQDKVDWFYISCNQNLSESFIREFQDKVDWYGISRYQKLSESFIFEFSDKLDWHFISKCQCLSEKIFKNFSEKIDWYYYIQRRDRLPLKVIKQYH